MPVSPLAPSRFQKPVKKPFIPIPNANTGILQGLYQQRLNPTTVGGVAGGKLPINPVNPNVAQPNNLKYPMNPINPVNTNMQQQFQQQRLQQQRLSELLAVLKGR